MQSLSVALHPDGTRARGSVGLRPAHSSASHGSCQGPPTAPLIPPKGVPGLFRLRLPWDDVPGGLAVSDAAGGSQKRLRRFIQAGGRGPRAVALSA